MPASASPAARLKSAATSCFALRAAIPFRTIAIGTDAYATWLGAFGGEDGAILILGTGSCGLAVVGGEQFQVSG